MKFEILSNENIKLNCLVHRMDWQILSNENIKFNCLVHRMDWQPVNYKRKDEEVHLIVWANFTLGSNSVKGKARANILYEEI